MLGKKVEGGHLIDIAADLYKSVRDDCLVVRTKFILVEVSVVLRDHIKVFKMVKGWNARCCHPYYWLPIFHRHKCWFCARDSCDDDTKVM